MNAPAAATAAAATTATTTAPATATATAPAPAPAPATNPQELSSLTLLLSRSCLLSSQQPTAARKTHSLVPVARTSVQR